MEVEGFFDDGIAFRGATSVTVVYKGRYFNKIDMRYLRISQKYQKF